MNLIPVDVLAHGQKTCLKPPFLQFSDTRDTTKSAAAEDADNIGARVGADQGGGRKGGRALAIRPCEARELSKNSVLHSCPFSQLTQPSGSQQSCSDVGQFRSSIAGAMPGSLACPLSKCHGFAIPLNGEDKNHKQNDKLPTTSS